MSSSLTSYFASFVLLGPGIFQVLEDSGPISFCIKYLKFYPNPTLSLRHFVLALKHLKRFCFSLLMLCNKWFQILELKTMIYYLSRNVFSAPSRVSWYSGWWQSYESLTRSSAEVDMSGIPGHLESDGLWLDIGLALTVGGLDLLHVGLYSGYLNCCMSWWLNSKKNYSKGKHSKREQLKSSLRTGVTLFSLYFVCRSKTVTGLTHP